MPAPLESKPLVVVGCGTGRAEYRERILAAMAARSPLVAFDAEAPTWSAPHLRDHRLVAPLTLEQLLATARSYLREHGAAGIATFDERYVEPVALLADELGLPGPGFEAVTACRDKWRTRQLLARAGAGAVAAELVHTAEAAVEAAARLGLPVVLKPRSLGASFGVVRAETPAEVAAGFNGAVAAAAAAPGMVVSHPGVLVEELVDGDEFSVDLVVCRGRVCPLFVARKTVSFPPHFEETGHVVEWDGVDRLAGITEFLQAVHDALGFRDGVTHTELRSSSSGYRIIEVNARIGGDLIPYLGLLATGIDLPAAVADLALGREPDLTATRRGAAAIRFLYPDRDLRVDAVRIPREVETRPDVVEAVSLATPGTVLRLPPRGLLARAALVIVTGADAGACGAELDHVWRRIAVTGRDADGG
jgi:biotin carboxylase